MSVIEQTWYRSDYDVDDVEPVDEGVRETVSHLSFMTEDVMQMTLGLIESNRDNEELVRHLGDAVNALADAMRHLDRVREMPYEAQ